MQISNAEQSFQMGGQTYRYTLVPARETSEGIWHDVAITDAAGRTVARRQGFHVPPGADTADLLAQELTSMMHGRPTLEDVRTEATTYQVRTDMGPTRPSLW